MASDDAGEPGDGVLEDDGELAAPSGAGTLLDPLDQLLQGRADHLTQKVVDLKKERDFLKQQKKEITQKLKMAEKKKKRLKTKAKELSSRDILDVIVMRANAKALAEDKKKKTECQDAKCPGLSK